MKVQIGKEWCEEKAKLEDCCEVGVGYESSTSPAGYVAMPKALTAENGAKRLLIGEFKVNRTVQCPDCDGFGYHMSPPDNVREECEDCKGAGELVESYPIPWTTIKEIYAMAVKHLAT